MPTARMEFSTPVTDALPLPNLSISEITSQNSSILADDKTSPSSDPLIGLNDQLQFLSSNSDNDDNDNVHLTIDNNMTESEMVISTDNDSNYEPSNDINTDTPGTSFENSSLKEKSSSFDNTFCLDIRDLKIPKSNFEQQELKKHFCPYCKKMQTKFARHLLLKHKNENEVQKFMYLPPKNRERNNIISKIRREGDFLHNTNREFNTGTLILPRRIQKKSTYSGDDFVPCSNCQLFLAKSTIRFHVSKCSSSRKKGHHNILNTGRRLAGYIHSCASPKLRRIVFPVLNDDKVVRCIKYDELIMLYGNKLCEKYTLVHQYDMIRAHLRLLGRFKLAIVSIDSNIEEFKDIYQPQNFDKVIEAIRKVAHWNENIMWFDTPAVAQSLTTLIKKCGKKFRTECIKRQDDENKKRVDDFLLLCDEEIPTLINKKALEDQITQKRQKKVILPSKSDIKTLYLYLKKESNICLEILRTTFDKAAWKLLSECTLVLLQIFNRRRAGEIERLTLIDYQNKESLDEKDDEDIYKTLSESTIKFAKQFVRLTIRGKLGRTVPVLLSPFLVGQIDVVLKFRKEAKVSAKNNFIFAVPNTKKLSKEYIRACPLLRRFADNCGALIPSTLRGTTLRKHIATYTAMLGIEENQIDRLADFMGHHKDIHKNIYRVSVPVAEITQVSRLLKAAMGDDNQNDDEVSDDQQNSDSSDDDNGIPYSRTGDSSEENIASTSSLHQKSKRKWSESEKNVVMKHFGDLKSLSKLPTLSECKELIDRNASILKNRTPQQLKTWIDNQRRAEARRRSYKTSTFV